ncbi:glucosamine-6-phosphate deaminase [Luteitalea sp. TBR-22]|uniref:glucosamine-6-phosphate deaminase n=1 Tax=Luteitalea sp. TBR-22 TaxID=2802971 RepID=UPI001AF5474E|nr:glucosamine-6-phosphate deaminase [Luteitalea sp. TBR-22]BCS33353.1 glucosamine-6-phosphate deaminase [Luteitalea sp. TBR-22]
MIISLCDSPQDVADLAAQRVADLLLDTPRAVLGLPTGRTPIAMYDELAARASAGEIDFSQVTSFNLDEFVGIGESHPGSYRAYMKQHLFDRVGLPAGQGHVLDGLAADADAECARFEAAIEAAGGIDLMILGLGANGHIGFNEPDAALQARTHRVTLLEPSRKANADFFDGDPAKVPAEAMTMGMGTILKSRRIMLLVTGSGKAATVAAMINGPVTTQMPASFLQLHGHVELICDSEAAAQIR